MVNDDIRGHLVLVMAPMASGKGTLVAHVRARFPRVTHTVSCTTRTVRPGEEEGKNYYFITREVFEERIEKGEFLEWAEFGGNLYGTLRSELLDRLVHGEVVIAEIEMQGVLQLCEVIPKEKRTIIYIHGGDWDALKARACARAPITEDELDKRYERYITECDYMEHADVVIDNQDGKLDDAKKNIENIFKDIIDNLEKQ